MAAATAVMQGKRVEILVPPQAAAWLQVCLLSLLSLSCGPHQALGEQCSSSVVHASLSRSQLDAKKARTASH